MRSVSRRTRRASQHLACRARRARRTAAPASRHIADASTRPDSARRASTACAPTRGWRCPRVKDARADVVPVTLDGVGRLASTRSVLRSRRGTTRVGRLRRARQTAAERPRRRHERGRILPRKHRNTGPLEDGRRRRRHGAGRRRRRGAESGVRAQHRRADAPDTVASRARRSRAGQRRADVRPRRCRPSASALLAARANGLATALAAATLLIYLVVYTPMKRRSPLATLVGAVPGGAAAGHRLDRVARIAVERRRRALRHRLSLADSALHGHRVAVSRRLPAGRLSDAAGDRARRPQDGTAGGRLCRALLPASLLPTLIGLSGTAYFVTAAALGVLSCSACRFASRGRATTVSPARCFLRPSSTCR